MTVYAEIIRLTLRHEFFDEAAVPVTVTPLDPIAFDREGLLVRHKGNQVSIIAPEQADDLLEVVQLVFRADDPMVLSVTEGADWNYLPHVSIPLGQDHAEFGQPDTKKRQIMSQSLLVRLDLQHDPDAMRDLELRFNAIRSLWAYHVIGADPEKTIEIVDTDEEMTFDDLGDTELPNGRTAKVIRSQRALIAKARPNQKFALQHAGPFGPVPLIPVLPAASSQARPLPKATSGARLQSDIYVTLF